MSAEFYQSSNKFGDIVTEIRVDKIKHIEDLKYQSKYWLKNKKAKEKESLINEINKLIDDFNKLNESLSVICLSDPSPNNPYNLGKIQKKAFEDYKLGIHGTYLMGVTLYENFKNAPGLVQRLTYIRTKEFEKFLKELEGKKSDYIFSEIRKLRSNKFKSWKKDVKNSLEYSYDFALKQIIQKYLRPKQRSRQKQLLAKFKVWKQKLSNPKNNKQKDFAGVVKSLVAIFSGNGKDLNPKELRILSECFGKYRNWQAAYEGPMVKKYNPFMALSNKTNRVIIALYGMVTDRDGKDIDAFINRYLV